LIVALHELVADVNAAADTFEDVRITRFLLERRAIRVVPVGRLRELGKCGRVIVRDIVANLVGDRILDGVDLLARGRLFVCVVVDVDLVDVVLAAQGLHEIAIRAPGVRRHRAAAVRFLCRQLVERMVERCHLALRPVNIAAVLPRRGFGHQVDVVLHLDVQLAILARAHGVDVGD